LPGLDLSKQRISIMLNEAVVQAYKTKAGAGTRRSLMTHCAGH